MCCVYWLNKLLYHYKIQRDGSYQNKNLLIATVEQLALRLNYGLDTRKGKSLIPW